MSRALDWKLACLAIARGSTEVDVLLKAIALYEIAFQTKLKDQWLAVVDDEKCVMSKIEGI